MPLTQKEKFALFLVGTAMVSFFIVTFLWSANDYYTDAYRVPMQQSKVMREKVEARIARDPEMKASNQPKAPGIREKDLNKREGRRYKTF